ncbi:hypothetical protein ACFV4M_25955 [Kitasatospora indigofera]|uniref:hypothetical protein n=1 Tax=Kitasatospora indigofera TaxID=67307 RepID=UPI00364ECAD9
MLNETPEQNRYARAMVASINRAGQDNDRGHQAFYDTNHKLLTEHAPADGAQPACTKCGGTWPCGVAQGAMVQVGVHS